MEPLAGLYDEVPAAWAIRGRATPRQGQVEGVKKVGVASLAGFEPATRCLEGSRSVQLSYRDILYLQV